MRARSLFVLGSIALVACNADQPSPIGPTDVSPSQSMQTPDDRPFYYYQGQPIYLRTDPTQIVVEGASETVRAALADAAAEVGVRTEAVALRASRQLWTVPVTDVGRADQMVARLRQDGRVAFASRAYVTEVGGDTFLPVNRLDVLFDDRATQTQIAALIAAHNLTLVREPKPDSGFFTHVFRYPNGADPLTIAQNVQGAPGIVWADPDRISNRRPHYVPVDPYYSLQFHLKNTQVLNGVTVDINVEQAWDLTIGSGSVTVAVVDDGIDIYHGEGWAGEINFAGVAGYDLLYDPAFNENAVMPCCNDTHGTSIAGIIAGQHANGNGGVGIAPNIVLQSIRIFRRTYPPESTTAPGTEVATDAEIAQGINWSWQSGEADVISNSWGGGAVSQAITTAITNALTLGRGGLGTVVVFAAGNTSARGVGNIGPVLYPATLSTTTNVITVGAINRYGQPADYTPDGAAIKIVAPSGHFTGACVGEVVTTDHFSTEGCNDGPNGDVNYTTTFSGTSAAAPQVAAVAALLLSREPTLTVAQVRSRILTAANPWGSAITYGSGKLNAYRTLSPLTLSMTGPSTITSAGTYTWQATAGGGGPYTYAWDYKPYGSSTWYYQGAQTSWQTFVNQLDAPYFDLRVTVTAGGSQAIQTRHVNVQLGGCGGGQPC